MRLTPVLLGCAAASMLLSACIAAGPQAPGTAYDTAQPNVDTYGEPAPTMAAALPTPTLTLAPTAVALDGAFAAQRDSVGAMARGDLARSGFYPGDPATAPLTATWQVPLADGIFTTPAIVGGALYVASGDGTLYALDRASGTITWQRFTGDWVLASPAVAHGLVFVLNRAGALLALDARTGADMWAQQLDGEGYASPLVAHGLLYTASTSGVVYAFDARSGAERWRFTLEGGVYSPPALHGGRLVVGSNTGVVVALDPASGAAIWQTELDGPVVTAPALHGELIYIGSADQHLYALDARTGAERWRYSAGGALSAPAVANGRVFVISQDGVVHAVAADTGNGLWQFAVDGRVYSVDLLAPIVAGNSVYVGSDNDEGQTNSALYLLDATSGRQLLRYDTKAALRSSPALADRTLYVGDALGTLYALRTASN